MLDSKAVFEEALQHFPKWMDIRKRGLKTTGGKFLNAIIEEVDDIQKAIDDFKRDYFAINYIGRESEIIDYLYVANIGDIEDKELILLEPSMKVITDYKVFEKSADPLAYYHEGRIAFKIKELHSDTIKYSLNGYKYNARVEKTHIWNIIDEFALFAGLTRYENETNKELLERSLLAFKNRTNSTDQGLKNAIINAVSNFTQVSPDEIRIEKPNQENLFKDDPEYGTVIERLAQLNKDTYRTKKWDLSKWEHPFKKLTYISPEWDTELEDIQDGVGHNDALKATLTSEIENSEATDVQIDAYEKSEVRINEYIRNQRLEVDIDLELQKFGNMLKPNEVEYKITATETEDISDDNVYVDCYKLSEGENEHYIQDLIINQGEIADITIERGKLKPNTMYRVKFYPEEEYSNMVISKSDLTVDGKTTSLLKEKGAFKFDENNTFRNSNVKLHASSTRDFMDYSNIMNTKKGFTLADATQDGTVAIDVSGMQNQYVKVEHECRETSIIRDTELVKYEGFIINDSNELESVEREGQIVIDLVCNQLYFEMEEGNCIVSKEIDGELLPSEIWFEAKSEQLKFDSPKRVKVTITKLNNDVKLRIKNIRYSRYDVILSLDHGNFINTNFGLIIPAGYENNIMRMTIRTYSGFSPVVKFVHVGPSLKNAVFETDIFNSGIGGYLDIDSNCKVELEEVNSQGKVLSTVKNYVTRNLYKNTKDVPVYLRINTDGFLNIRRTYPAIERFSYQGQMSNFIKLEPGQEIDRLLIEGSMLVLLGRVYLNDLLRDSQYDKIYISKKLKGFIVKTDVTEKLVKVTKAMLHNDADVYRVGNMPPNVKSAFVIDDENNIESVSDSHERNFQYFYMSPSVTQEYVAYNNAKLIRPEVDDVEIVDVFMPIIPPNRLFIYTIDEVDNDGTECTVLFKKNDGYENWSLGKKKIQIKMKLDSVLSSNYEVETYSLSKKFILSNNIELEQEQTTNSGATIDLAEYIVKTPSDIRVIYENRVALPENIIVEEDGFNKLRYSNITAINSIKHLNDTVVPSEKYQLLKEEGIIAWSDGSLVGEELVVEYRYGVPRYLTFTNIERLYELVGYNVDAYRHLFTVTYKDLRNDAYLNSEDAARLKTADRIITSCSNPSFRAKVENDILRLIQINNENRIAVKTGFFYQDGVEYYYFINRNENLLEKLNNIDLINTQRLSGSVIFSQKSTNLLPDSAMEPRRLAEACRFDFVNNKKIGGLSKMDALTACDQFNYWHTFEMDLSFTKGLNGLGITLNALSEEAYAMLEITKYIDDHSIISLYTEGGVEVSIAREIKYKGQSYNKSVFAEPYKEMKKHQEFSYFVFDKDNYDPNYRYFLLVKKSGLVDDIVVKDYDENEDIAMIHKKNIDKLGFNVEEHIHKDYVQTLLFDAIGNKLDCLEISSDGLMRTGVNVDWGLTKIEEFKDNWTSCTLKEVDLVKGQFIRSTNRTGMIETEPFYVRNKGSIRNMIFKVNEVLTDETSGFRIEILTSSTLGGLFNLIATEESGNKLIVPHNRLSNYVKLRVEMPPHKVINNIEIFSEYVETDSPLRVGTYQNGQLTTKIYDTGFVKHYRLKKLAADAVKNLEDIELHVRAFRQEQGRIVWTDWKQAVINKNLDVTNKVDFEGYRYFQFKILFRSEHAEMRLNSIDLEVIE